MAAKMALYLTWIECDIRSLSSYHIKLKITLAIHQRPGPRCTKLTIDGNFAINGNYHGNLDFDWLLSPVTMVVAIDGKVTINGKFYATGPISELKHELDEL